MQQNNKKRTILLISALALAIVLGVVAVITALKLRQLATVPVTPNAPASQPQAAIAPVTINGCFGSFDIGPQTCGTSCTQSSDCLSSGSIALQCINNKCLNPECTENTTTCICPSPTPTVTLTPTVTPTVTLGPSTTPGPSATPGPSITPTLTPTPTRTPTPTPTTPPNVPTNTPVPPTNTPRPTATLRPNAPTPIPTIEHPTIPQAGTTMPSYMMAGIGALLLVTGLVLVMVW